MAGTATCLQLRIGAAPAAASRSRRRDDQAPRWDAARKICGAVEHFPAVPANVRQRRAGSAALRRKQLPAAEAQQPLVDPRRAVHVLGDGILIIPSTCHGQALLLPASASCSLAPFEPAQRKADESGPAERRRAALTGSAGSLGSLGGSRMAGAVVAADAWRGCGQRGALPR